VIQWEKLHHLKSEHFHLFQNNLKKGKLGTNKKQSNPSIT